MSKESKNKSHVKSNRRYEAFIRYLSGKSFQIEKKFGQEYLEKVLLMSEFQNDTKSDALSDMCQQEKDYSQGTTIYSSSGTIIGKYEDLDEIPSKSVAVVHQRGVMMDQDAMCSYGMNTLDTRLRNLYSNNSIDGIIMKINTGGGQTTAGSIAFNAINDRNKPIVVLSNFLASAGIKETLVADEIIGETNGAMFGSIGVMMSLPKWYVQSEKEDNIELYSKNSQNKNKAWRDLKEGDTASYVDWLTEVDEVFMQEVRKHRPLKGTPTERKHTLSGEVFLAKEAKSRGLIDGIGSFNYALKRLKSHISYTKK